MPDRPQTQQPTSATPAIPQTQRELVRLSLLLVPPPKSSDAGG